MMKQMSNKKANIAISENNKLIVSQNSQKKNSSAQTSHDVSRDVTVAKVEDGRVRLRSGVTAKSSGRFNSIRVLYLLIQLY